MSSFSKYVGNGAQTVFSVNQPMPSYSALEVSLDGLVETTGFTYNRTNATVTFTVAPADGVVVKLSRVTQVELIHKFATGAAFTARNVDTNFTQESYRVEELQDNVVGVKELEESVLQASEDAEAALAQLLASSTDYIQVGTFAAGYDSLQTVQQTLLHSDGHRYGWTGAFPKVVSAGSTPTPLGAGGWVDRSDVTLRSELAADGGAQLVKNSVRWFDSIQLMLAATDLDLGQKVCTGASTWKITTSNKGIPLSNGIQYALALNGVFIDDAGADATGASDSHAAIMYVLGLYQQGTRRRFSVVSNGGTYKTSAEIALHSQTSGIRINLCGATVEATANVNAVISCLAITGLRIKSLTLQHSVGVTITTAMMLLNSESSNTNKLTRVIIDDISAGLTTGAPQFLMCDKMWESEIRRLRVDFDVTGFTGRCLYLRSCVNVTVQPVDLEYAAEGINFGKNTNVSYGCEGITVLGGVIANCNVPVVGNNATAVRFIGTVMDFCNNSGPTFTNGQDVILEGCWIANKSTSAAGWNGVVAPSTFTKVKISGCHFVNNTTNNCNCASLLSPGSVFTGNTASSLMLPGARASDVRESCNTYGVVGVANYREVASSFSLIGESGIAPLYLYVSGKTSAASGDLLSRISLSATGVNSNNVFNIDHIRGFSADIARLRLGWGATAGWDFNPADWHITCMRPGAGIRLTSPDGLVTKVLRLSNAGAIELV